MSFLSFVFLACSLSYNAFAVVTWDTKPFNPPSVPLAVRTPYLSAWLPQGSGTALNDAWPTFWTGSVWSVSFMWFAARSSRSARFWAGRGISKSMVRRTCSWVLQMFPDLRRLPRRASRWVGYCNSRMLLITPIR